MPGIPYLVYGQTKESGSGVSGATVKARNETNNEVISISADSNGIYIFDANKFSSGWSDGDSITVYVIYTDFEGQETITIDTSVAYSTEQDITLSSVSDNELIYYCTVQDVYDELDAKTSTDISASRIVKAIQRAEGLIDLKTGTAFKEVTITDEVHTADRYSLDISPDYLDTISSMDTLRRDSMAGAILNRVKVNYTPIVSITSVSVNQSGYNSADSWVALTEQTGSSGDYVLEDSNAGVIDFLTTYPRIGKRSWKITYVYGYDRDSTNRQVIAILKVVERLTILLACKSIITTKSTGAIFDTTRDIKIGAIELRGGAQSSSQYLTSIDPEIMNLWRELGDQGIEVI